MPGKPSNGKLDGRRRTMKTTKAGALAVVAMLLLTLSGCANLGGIDLTQVGKEGTTTYLKIALNQTESHPSYIALDHFGQRLAEKTNGRWKVDVYPNEQLGSQQEVVQFIKSGAIEMAIVSGTQLENLSKDFQVLNLPKAFKDVRHQMQVIRDPSIVGELFTSLEKRDNITVIGGFTQGSRSIYTRFGPVNKPADLKGKKIRVQESDMHIRMIELMGGSATPLSYGEVYTALQSGVLDGAENNEVSYLTQKHVEVAPYWSYTNHLVGLDYMIMRADLLKAMSDADRKIFLEEWDKAMVEHTKLWSQKTSEAIEGAKKAGAKMTKVEGDAFDKALAPLVDEFLTTKKQRELWDKIQAAQTGASSSGATNSEADNSAESEAKNEIQDSRKGK
ncbi:TRAP transporter solute receptor, DctP family [Mobiluncus mulieris 28-1]|uniref:Neu5Ac-binding protein n=2 Tax=Mobiluncus mulieris TaxID=2052 RepID=A0A378PFE1_9ACTO|nr:TRAP transporter solute receptor, DctP family [Mobiluncus mulieris 28-1]STO16923.1 Neu5Ac-binding protein [Mobiluncus mulieris]STY85289.1 Neu5Ac-binding protein [Mobiluncus mulieris]